MFYSYLYLKKFFNDEYYKENIFNDIFLSKLC